MNKFKQLSLLTLSALLIVSGCTACGRANKDTTPSVDVITTIPEDTEDSSGDSFSSDSTDDSTDAAATPSHEGMVRSRLTNEWVDPSVASTRPIAVMIPNSKTASQYGLSRADILYECNVEASMTRLMAIFDDWSNFEKLGNIRSCRDYFAYWAFEWDAVIVHYGGPFYMDEIMGATTPSTLTALIMEALITGMLRRTIMTTLLPVQSFWKRLWIIMVILISTGMAMQMNSITSLQMTKCQIR